MNHPMIWKAILMKLQQLQPAGQPVTTVTQLTAHVVTGITMVETQDLFSTPMKVMEMKRTLGDLTVVNSKCITEQVV